MVIGKRLYIILLVFAMVFSCKHPKENNASSSEIQRPENACKVSVLSQVNGAYARDVRLTISESGSGEKVFEGICYYGVAFPKLEEGKHYDFAIDGNELYANSLVKNLKIKSNTDDIAIVCLKKIQKNRISAFLELKEFKLVDGSNETEIVDGTEVETPIEGNFTAKVASKSGAIHESIANGFSAKIGLGRVPSSSWRPTQDITGSPEEYPEFKDGEWISTFTFPLGGGVWESYAKKEQDLIAVFYDVAGNRLESHNYVICKPKTADFQKYTGSDYHLASFYVEAKTYSAYNQMYSERETDDVCYAPTIFFNILDKEDNPQNKVGVVAVEVFRREAVEGKENEFQHIFTSSFRDPENIVEDHTSPIPCVLDRTGTYELGKEYEYKAKIYIQDGFYFETGVARCKILPQCKVYLAKPEMHASISLPSRYAPFNDVLQDFAIRISDASMWDAKKSDYFTCGLVISKYDVNEIYRMLFRYHFNYNGTGKEELEFLANYNGVVSRTTFTKLKKQKIIPYYVEIKDFIEWDATNSLVVMKKDMLTTRVFNIIDKWDTFKDGEVYYWDVFGLSGEFPENVRGLKRMPPVFTKEYKDEKGVVSYSNSYCAGLMLTTTSSWNGRFDFTVKSENKLSNEPLLVRPSMKNIVKGVYLVKADDRFETSVASLNAKIIAKMSLEEGLSWYCVEGDGHKDILTSLLRTTGVRCADYEHKISFPQIQEQKKDVLSTLSFDGDVVFKGSCYSLEITQALKAYEEIGFGNGKVLLGIVDSGVSLTHEDLIDANGDSIIKDYFVQEWEFVPDGKGNTNAEFKGWNSSRVDTDLHGHGTHCVGVMAALQDNGKGIVGVSGKNTQVVVYRGLFDKDSRVKGAETFCTMDAIRRFTDYVKEMRANGKLNQACVPFNLSVGDTRTSPLALEVINYALANGVLPVVAMGNDGLYTHSYPSAYKGVLAVGSSDGSDRVSGYSNSGEWISIVAPGENIVSLSNTSDSGYVVMNGTSMATPFATGAVAYLAGLNPELTPQQIKSILERTADKIGGSEDFNTRRGYGRINVYKAAKLVKEGGVEATQSKYSSFALKAKIEPKIKDENGETDIAFKEWVPYVFLYDDRGVCVAGGYLVSKEKGYDKPNENVVEFRGLEKGRYTLKVDSYVYTDWPKVYRLLDEKTVDFTGEEDEIVEFGRYVVIKK